MDKKTSTSAESGIRTWKVTRQGGKDVATIKDKIAVEEPLEIKVEYGPENARRVMPLSVTMRTPGHDAELTRGFLYTEGIIAGNDDLLEIENREEANTALARLSPDCNFSPEQVSRHFYASSSCGVCGKASIDMVRIYAPWILRPNVPKVQTSLLPKLSRKLRKGQEIFSETGGLHASGLFTTEGEMVLCREDIGRHNALDKLIGAAMQAYPLPLSDLICVVSGRAGFELIQKAWMAGIAVFAAVGAPSSLAVELADQQEMTLIGFLKPDSWNIYSGEDRVI